MSIESHPTHAGGSPSAGGLDWAGSAQARGDAAWLAALRADWAAEDTTWGHPETPAAWWQGQAPAAERQPASAATCDADPFGRTPRDGEVAASVSGLG